VAAGDDAEETVGIKAGVLGLGSIGDFMEGKVLPIPVVATADIEKLNPDCYSFAYATALEHLGGAVQPEERMKQLPFRIGPPIPKVCGS
jgi:hypothetical protein